MNNVNNNFSHLVPEHDEELNRALEESLREFNESDIGRAIIASISENVAPQINSTREVIDLTHGKENFLEKGPLDLFRLIQDYIEEPQEAKDYALSFPDSQEVAKKELVRKADVRLMAQNPGQFFAYSREEQEKFWKEIVASGQASDINTLVNHAIRCAQNVIANVPGYMQPDFQNPKFQSYITRLDLSTATNLTSANLEAITLQFPHITYMKLSGHGTGLDDMGVGYVVHNLPRLKTILCVNANGIGDVACANILSLDANQVEQIQLQGVRMLPGTRRQLQQKFGQKVEL